MFSLTQFRQSAKDALAIYEEIWNERRHNMAIDEICRELTDEEVARIFENVPGFKPDSVNFFGKRYTIQGPLPEEMLPSFVQQSVETYDTIISYLENNRLQAAIWFATMYTLDGATSNIWGCNVRYTSIVFSGDENVLQIREESRNNIASYAVHQLLTEMATITISKTMLLKGLARVKENVKDWTATRSRLGNKGKGEGIKKALGEGPKLDNDIAEKQIADAIAAMPENALVARTWGFEIEVPDAKGVEPVHNCGIEKGDDGSLRSYNSDDCECSCNSCSYHECNCDNCEDYNDSPDHDCGYSECAQADSAEFRTTGGIIKSKHAAMFDLCEKLNKDSAEMNDSAGTHIHVYAADLTTHEVGQVMAIYTYLESLMTNVAGRYNVSYAGKMNMDHVAAALKKSEPKLFCVKPLAINVSHLFGTRGTIEFRQMDCNLNAERITFWAWLVRGLVEVAKRGAKFSDFRGVIDINGIIDVYAKFNFMLHDENPGKFIPGSRSDQAFVKVQKHNAA